MAGPTLTPPVPSLGIPVGEKERGKRVDFKPEQFDVLIESKGYLLAWTRACVCPCSPVASQSENPDPNCALCNGGGWYYFGGNQVQDLSGYEFDDVQQSIIDAAGAMVIRGVITSIQNQYDPWDKIGNWQAGSMQLTVRHENKLGYYDKVVLLNSEIVYSEIIEYSGAGNLETRYPVTGVNQLRSADTEYQPEADFVLTAAGEIEWLAGKAPTPATGEDHVRLAMHYLCHPTFRVVEHPHVIRTTSRKFKTPDPVSPTGDPRPLPIQALVRYDFLP